MESASSCGREILVDVSFGIENANYSDRTLLLQIIDSEDITPHHLRTTATTASRMKTIHINSLILAARSPFFRKLFSNGMRESEEKHVTLRIQTSEEASLLDLLKYIYTNDLPTSLNALLDLCVIADKFEVVSCLRDCIHSLETLPMNCESASLYLDLSQSLLMFPTIHPLIQAAKKFLVTKFEDFHKFEHEMLNLSLASIQTVLSSDDLQVTSECAVYDFVLTWARKHYPDLEERREMLKTHLLHFIRFAFMTTTKLTEEVQICSDIDTEVASKIVIQALRFKAETPHQKRRLAAVEGNVASRQFVERAYKYLPVKVVELALPLQQSIIYVNFSREKLRGIFPEGEIQSESFHLGEEEVVLFVRCYKSTINKLQYFVLGLGALGSGTYKVKYEIQLRMKYPEEEFKSWAKGSHMFMTKQGLFNYEYLKRVPWDEFIGDNSTYFVNNLLHVRADLTIIKSGLINHWIS